MDAQRKFLLVHCILNFHTYFFCYFFLFFFFLNQKHSIEKNMAGWNNGFCWFKWLEGSFIKGYVSVMFWLREVLSGPFISSSGLDSLSVPTEMLVLSLTQLLPAYNWWLRAQNNEICTVETWLWAVIMQLLILPFVSVNNMKFSTFLSELTIQINYS